MTLSAVMTLTSSARAIVAPLLAAYFLVSFIHFITSMFYHLLSVTCCGISSRLINKRRYTHTLYAWQCNNWCSENSPVVYLNHHMGGDLAPSLGGRTIFFADQILE